MPMMAIPRRMLHSVFVSNGRVVTEFVIISGALENPRAHFVVLFAKHVVALLVVLGVDSGQIEQQMGQGVGHEPAVTGLYYLPVDVGMSVDITWSAVNPRSEEHTSELQSRQYLVCRLLLEKKTQLDS